MPTYDISVVKVAQTIEEFEVTAENEERAKKIAIEIAKKTEFDHGDPEIVVDMVLEHKEESETDGHD